jgi:Domain of unknown function (DUF3291)
MPEMSLAQINIGRLVAPIDDPRIADFVNQLDAINALAEGDPGFVWRLKSDSGNATEIAYNDDPLVIVNLSVWKDIPALRNYVYRSQHVTALRDRQRWFEKMALPHYCLWWIEAGHLPTVAEGRERLEHYQALGPTSVSFWFGAEFPPPVDEPVLVTMSPLPPLI